MGLAGRAGVGLVGPLGVAGQGRISQLPFGEVVGCFDFWRQDKFEQLFGHHQTQQFVDEIAKVLFRRCRGFRKACCDGGPVRMAEAAQSIL